jgi:hypothetical protein
LSPAAEDLRQTMERLVRADGLARMKPVVPRLRSA